MESSKSKFVFHLSSILNELIKNFVYKLHLGKISNDKVTITKLLGMTTIDTSYLKPLAVNYNQDIGLYQFDDEFLFASVTFGNANYELSFRTLHSKDFGELKTIKSDMLWISGISDNADQSRELSFRIIEESVKASNLNGSTMKYCPGELTSGDLLTMIKIIETPEIKLDNLFIPDSKKDQINRFVFALNHFREKHLSLRYLFNGKPGTGKTQLINSIINETNENVTVLICNGGSLPVKEIFGFCEYFNPCLLIIDDLDFIAGDRADNMNRNGLSNFLQFLDGFLPNNVFILAATNDKKLVDEAASRPGRFDLILDIGEINSEHYMSLVKRETQNETILSFFNEITLNELRTKKVTGAFIVSLVKQLESAQMMKGELTNKDFTEYLELTHKGFYSYNDETFEKKLGFYQ
jgi:predicted AAA+ superfamily ATPase